MRPQATPSQCLHRCATVVCALDVARASATRWDREARPQTTRARAKPWRELEVGALRCRTTRHSSAPVDPQCQHRRAHRCTGLRAPPDVVAVGRRRPPPSGVLSWATPSATSRRPRLCSVRAIRAGAPLLQPGATSRRRRVSPTHRSPTLRTLAARSHASAGWRLSHRGPARRHTSAGCPRAL